ncbi:MAG: hypothetical protein H2038_01945 [Brevundimonas sp.]|uniref:hypothetical protein n=1 Tax=Brevundimonas sp. TaxID=1871086 RepID=UPI00183EF76E|nr:hypothetical protein [Brevundimonas sp.]MBA4803393.1 hypothetical protein [Brevundimonas sp.]
MSCGVALAVSLLLADPAVAEAAARPPAEAGAPVSVAGEPLFADIVARSGDLRGRVGAWMAAGAAERADFAAGEAWTSFRARATELAALDMQGHLVLKERGTDGDLKCILRGIAEDMPRRLEAVEAAAAPAERRVALDELHYLLNDNVEVITAPPQPEV